MNNISRPNSTIVSEASEAAIVVSPSRFRESQQQYQEEDHYMSGSPHNVFPSKNNSKNTSKDSRSTPQRSPHSPPPPPPPMSPPPLSPSYSPSQRFRNNSRRFHNRHPSSPIKIKGGHNSNTTNNGRNSGGGGSDGGGILLSTFFDRQQQEKQGDRGGGGGSKGDDMYSIAGETMLTEDLEKKGLCRVIEIHDHSTSAATLSPCPSISPRSGRPRLPRGSNRPTMEDKRQLSFLSLSDESYIMDLATQKDQRAEERHQEALEEALDIVNAYVKTIEPKHLRPAKDSEEYAALFLKILAKTKQDIELKYKEHDEMIDEKLEEAVQVELTRRQKQKQQQQQSQDVTTITSISSSLHSSNHSHRYIDSSHQSTTAYGLDDISEGGQDSNSSTSSSSSSSSSRNSHDDDERSQSTSCSDSTTQKDFSDAAAANKIDSTKTASMDGYTDPTHYTTMSEVASIDPTSTSNSVPLADDENENEEDTQNNDKQEKTKAEKETSLPQINEQKDDNDDDDDKKHDLVFDEISVHDEEELTVDSDDALVLEGEVDEDEEVIEEEIIEEEEEEIVVEEETIDDVDDDDFIEFCEDEIEFVGDVIDISLKVMQKEPDTKDIIDAVKTDTKTDTKCDITTLSSDLAVFSPKTKDVPSEVFSPRSAVVSSGRETTLIADVANCKNYRNPHSPGLNVLRSPTIRSPSSKLADRIKLFDSPPRETLDILSPTPTKLRRVWQKQEIMAVNLEDHDDKPSSVKTEDPITPSRSSETIVAGTPKNVPTDSIKKSEALRDTNTFVSPVQKKSSPAVLYDASTLSKKLAKVKKMIIECTDSKEMEKLQKKQRSYEDDLAVLKKRCPRCVDKGTSKSVAPRHFDPLSSSSEEAKQSKVLMSPSAVTALENSPFDECSSPVLTKTPLQSIALSPKIDSNVESTTNKKPDENEVCKTTEEEENELCSTKFTLADFEQGRVHDVDMSEWELYLTSTEFVEHFGMSIDDFSKQPKWKRERLKRKVRKNF